ncbi:SDR family NAD(P)-dependent oxidoreductase [Nonomuraea sp. FMUSA5-5]|uniref:SDR family NAD(P)-dependent oxidoreductase n=1 Tax=Nonomuraea composti TaxID=2720023 RepID=A0ABX1BGJ7_9ACTN|nr:SDR family NAD(P)-dependent oxidoreductase [Nonomuraea sp. FMUSA5-5]NJP94864.1 SDR family NAD(P)-dependent oxidoreductase [Nonomuraea sp. FMUSA5-5]
MLVEYSTAKAALNTLIRTLSIEFSSHGVRVKGASPGPVRTPLWTA